MTTRARARGEISNIDADPFNNNHNNNNNNINIPTRGLALGPINASNTNSNNNNNNFDMDVDLDTESNTETSTVIRSNVTLDMSKYIADAGKRKEKFAGKSKKIETHVCALFFLQLPSFQTCVVCFACSSKI